MPALVRGAEDRASESGYSLFLSNVDRHWEKLVTHTSAMVDKGVEAIAYAAWTPGRSDEAMQLARQAGVGVARLVPSVAEAGPGCVGLDNAAAMQQAVQHLWNQGHRRFAYVSMSMATANGPARQQGLTDALRERGGDLPNEAIFEDQRLTSQFDELAEIESGHRGGLVLLSRVDRPTAVCAMSDMVAVGVMRAAVELKLRVPEDVSVIGFDDTPLARLVQPALTTLAVPRHEIGRTLADMLLRRDWEAPGVIVLPELVVRGSSGAAPQLHEASGRRRVPGGSQHSVETEQT
jgi:LacI family transcriptional regulator